jgi:hypothetical protein
MVHELNQPHADRKPIGVHVIPNTGRQFYWTGKVAIGIAHQANRNLVVGDAVTIQSLLLKK